MTLAADIAGAYLERVADVVATLDHDEIGELCRLFEKARERDATIWFVGNGAKAPLADGFAYSLTVGLSDQNPALAFHACSLMSSSAALSGAASDYGADALWHIVSGSVRHGDVLVALSGAGDGLRILRAVEACVHWRITTIGIGRPSGRLEKMVDHFVRVLAQDEDGPTEDAVMMIIHAVHAYFKLGNTG